MQNNGFGRKVLSAISMFLLVLTTSPGGVAFAQTNQLGQAPTTGWQKSKLSQAIVDDADQAVEILLKHSQSGQLSSLDLENAAMALKILFDHYQEIGLNAALQKQLLANQGEFLNLNLSDPRITAFQAKLAANGINVNSSKIRSTLDPSPEQRQQFLSTVKALGLYRTEMDIVARLVARAQSLATAQASSTAQISRLSPNMRGHLELVSTICTICFIEAGAGLLTGCTYTEIACMLAINSCTVCAAGG